MILVFLERELPGGKIELTLRQDLLAGAFCLQELEGVPFVVQNEKGETLEDYFKSAYDNIGDKA